MSARAEIRSPRARASSSPRYPRGHTAGAGLPLGRLDPARPAAWRKADAVLAVGLLALIVILGNVHDMPEGLPGFLELRLSVKNALLIGAFAWVWPVVLSLCGLYAPRRLRTGNGEWPRLAIAGVVGAVLAMIFPLTGRSGAVTPLYALTFGAAFVPAARLLRVSVRALERKRSSVLPRQVVIVGSGPRAAEMYRALLSDPHPTARVIGFIDSTPQSDFTGNGAALLGSFHDLDDVLMHNVVDDVLIGLPVKSHYDEIRRSLAACARAGVPASYSADMFGGHAEVADAAGHTPPVMSMSATPSPELLHVKRTIDVVGSLAMLVVTAPLMLGIAIAIKLTSRGPVFFGQDRYGSRKRLFRMYKFRTMVVGAEGMQGQMEDLNEASGPVFKIRADPRITPIGRFLRKSSLDELPQLWNVLTGEMSLVGPRPLPVRDVARFDEPWLMRRFSMRPGLTCLWQVSGRSDLGFDRWVALDLEYIDRWSLALDVVLLLKTIPAVLNGRGAN